jgi:hypothetical protein
MGYRLDGPGSIPGRTKFIFYAASKPTLGPTQPLIKLVSGALSARVKRPDREGGGSSAFSAEVKTGGGIT